MPSRILITGATGFIGSEVFARLVKRVDPASLYLLGRRKPNVEKGLFADRLREHGLSPAILDQVHVLSCDFQDPEAFRATLNKLEGGSWIVVHLAALIHAKGAREVQERVNLGVTKDLLDWLNPRGGHFIFSSSVVAFGGTVDPELRFESDFDHFPPESAAFDYYTTKRAAHIAVREQAKVPVTLLCPGIVHGPLEHYKESRGHLRALREGRLGLAPSGGGGIVGLDKVAEAICEAVLAPNLNKCVTRLLVEKNWSYVEYFRYYVRMTRGDQAQRIRAVPPSVGILARRVGALMARLGLHSSLVEGLAQGSLYTYFQSEIPLPRGLKVEQSLQASVKNLPAR